MKIVREIDFANVVYTPLHIKGNLLQTRRHDDLPRGSAEIPSLTFQNDDESGLFYHMEASSMCISCNAAPIACFTSNGVVAENAIFDDVYIEDGEADKMRVDDLAVETMFANDAYVNIAQIKSEFVELQYAENTISNTMTGNFSTIEFFGSNLTINPESVMENANIDKLNVNSMQCTTFLGNLANIVEHTIFDKSTDLAEINMESVINLFVEDTRANIVHGNVFIVDAIDQSVAQVLTCTSEIFNVEILSNDVMNVVTSSTVSGEIGETKIRTARFGNVTINGNLFTAGAFDDFDSRVEISKAVSVVHDDQSTAMHIKQLTPGMIFVARDDSSPVFIVYDGGRTHIHRNDDPPIGIPSTPHVLTIHGDCFVDDVLATGTIVSGSATIPNGDFSGPVTIGTLTTTGPAAVTNMNINSSVNVNGSLNASGTVSASGDVIFGGGTSLVNRFSSLIAAIQQTKSSFSASISSQFATMFGIEIQSYDDLRPEIVAALADYEQQISEYDSQTRDEMLAQYQAGYLNEYPRGYADGYAAGGPPGRSAGFQAGKTQIDVWQAEGASNGYGYQGLFAQARSLIASGWTGTAVIALPDLMTAFLEQGNPPPPPPPPPDPNP